MNQFQIIKNAIQAFLESHQKVSSFYIGKTENFERRKEEHFNPQGDGYTYMWKIAEGTPSLITEMEDKLISYFKTTSFSSLLDNRNVGSGGNPEAVVLYFCVKYNICDINELGEDFVSLDDKKIPVKLD